jgi:hypothetical protein
MLEGIYRTLVAEDYPYRILTGDFNLPQEELPTGEVITRAYNWNSKGEYIHEHRNERWDKCEMNMEEKIRSSSLIQMTYIQFRQSTCMKKTFADE